MTGEVIDVCQDCGHLIEPVEVTFGRDRYRITLCMRDECIIARMGPITWERPEPPVLWSRGGWSYYPVANDPKAIISITGV